MPRRFITKSDVARLLEDGGTQLVLTPNCTVTDEAMEYARARGMRIVRGDAEDAASVPAPAPPGAGPAADGSDRDAVRAAVIAKLGARPADLDRVIDRVLRDHR